jgi:hypothetical protein
LRARCVKKRFSATKQGPSRARDASGVTWAVSFHGV